MLRKNRRVWETRRGDWGEKKKWGVTPVLGAEQMVRISWWCWHRGLSTSLSKIILLRNGTCTHARAHRRARARTHTFVHANSDIMHGCPLRFIIKALSGCTGSEGVNMNRIKQIVWCVKDRHSSSKVLKLSLPVDWRGMRVGAKNERSPSFISLRLFRSSRGVSKALRHCLCKVPVSARGMSIK